MNPKKLSKMEKLEEAIGIYNDIKDFFESREKTAYLTTAISIVNVHKVLNEIECIFVEHDEFERCDQITKWKTLINESTL
jgi:hypothetical protein